MPRKKDPFIGDYASKEERYFSWWIDEMVKAGHILAATYQPRTFDLTPKVEAIYIHRRTKQLKTKVKHTVEERRTPVINAMSYTPDWCVLFSGKFIRHLDCVIGRIGHSSWPQRNPVFKLTDGYWWVDVKGAATRFDDGRYFTAMQKITLDKHGVYTQRVEISNKVGGFFDRTFTPNLFRSTDKSNKKRVLKYDPITLNQFSERYFL